MKNSIFNAVCKMRYLALLLVLILTCGNVWGAEETITFSSSTSTTSGSGNTFTITWTNGTSCTINQSRGTSNTNVANYTTAPRWYQNHLITFTPRSGYTISKVVITDSSSNNGQTMTFNSGSGSIDKTSNTVTTVSGSWSSAFILKMGSQCRPSTVKITYTPSGTSHTLSSAVSPAASGGVELSSTSVIEGSTATATATPAAHYVFDHWSISGTGASLSSTTTNPTTVTMGTADATVTATFVATPKASVTLSEAGATTTDATTYYVGDSYTLPSTTEAVCGTKVLVGWSTVTVSETDIKPASNFYEKGETVTLEASQTFYAVFANASGGGGGEPTAYTAGDEGTYVLAVYVNEKWYALPANPTVNSGKISGVEITVSNTGGVDYVTSVNASGFEWTIANATNGQTISDGSNYIYHSTGGASGTNLAYGDGTTYTWTIASEQNGLTFKGTNGTSVGSRGLLASGKTFGGYSLSNEDASGYYRIHVLPIGGGTTYSAYSTECGACGGNPTIGVASLSGVFSSSSVGVTVTGCAVGTNCSWTDYGFVWGTSENPTVRDNILQVGTSGSATTWVGTLTGSFTTGMTYHYRAYGKNGYAGGTYQYSSDQTFTPRSVTFNLNGHGSAITTQIVKDGAKATDPGNPSEDGWRFDGWYDNESFTGSAWNFSSNTVTGNITLYAKWTQVYTVTYNYNGGSGSCVAGGPYAEGETVTTCAAPTRSGYTFKGWSDGVTTYNAGSTISNVQNDIVLTAQWTATTYTITYNGVKTGAENTNPTSYTVEDLPINLVAATHEQWRFDGWTDDNAGNADITTIPAGTTGNQNFTAHWTQRYAVTWYEESTPTVTYFDPGTTLQFPADPSAPASCSEKEFVGWMVGTITGETDDKPTFISSGEVNADAAYHAVWATQYEESGTKTLFSDQLLVTGTAAVSTPRDGWSSISYAYGYNGNGIRLSSGSNGASMTVDLSGKELGSTLTITFDAAKYGNENGSLSLSCLDEGANPTFSPASFTISNASWEEKSCTINNVDGKVASITLTGTKDHRFYMKNFKVTTSGMVTKYKEYSTSCCDNNVAAPSVTATATRNSITLSWANVTDATGYKVTINGGTHDVTTAACTYTESDLTSGTDYAWTVIATYNPANYCGAIPTKNTTTTLSVYGVTYNKNTTIGSGTVTMSPMPSDVSTYVVGENVTAAAKPATCTNSGYTFNGWNTEPDGTGTHVDAEGTIPMVEGGLTLYAEWVAKRAYYIDRMHGQGDQTIEIGGKTYHCYYGDGYHTTPSPSDQKSGDACQAPHYRFVRWLTRTHINNDGTQKDTGGAVGGGVQRGTVTDGETYYAIWEEEIDE